MAKLRITWWKTLCFKIPGFNRSPPQRARRRREILRILTPEMLEILKKKCISERKNGWKTSKISRLRRAISPAAILLLKKTQIHKNFRLRRAYCRRGNPYFPRMTLRFLKVFSVPKIRFFCLRQADCLWHQPVFFKGFCDYVFLIYLKKNKKGLLAGPTRGPTTAIFGTDVVSRSNSRRPSCAKPVRRTWDSLRLRDHSDKRT